MKILSCEARHLGDAAALFDQYRMFYEQPGDSSGAKAFIQSNLDRQLSRVFLVYDDYSKPVAFAQLYPSVCSITMRPFWYLSDLFVAPAARRQGYARSLMRFLIDHFSAMGAQRLTLDTAKTNLNAQALYESLGYEPERVYVTYHKVL